ncbi:MAG: glycosyltransferase family 2 protein [Bdellovibrionales bacterium]|nr:glycosyltransferase family 2 protein [Bdellovibrionales bacterium]
MQDKHLPRIAIICVNYENRAEGLRFLQALSDLNLSVIDVFMVDNSEKEKFKSEDLLALPWAKLLSNGQNLGYWGAFMVGLKAALLQTTPYDWIVLSNPDITFDPDFFDQLLKGSWTACK